MSEKVEIKKKICLLGSYGVGKTSLVRRIVHNKFEAKYLSTIGVQISRKTLNNHSGKVNFYIWDIANIEKFDSVVKNYIFGAHGAIIVADLTRPSSLSNSSDFAENFKNINPDGELLFVGNKTDLKNDIKISEDEFRDNFTSTSNNIFFTSAKSGENVDEMFRSLGLKLIGAEKSG